MVNLFDGLQGIAENIVQTAMGYPATWTPSNGSPAQSGTVLLNRPTQREDMSDEDYALIFAKCEYLYGVFPGLFESVQSSQAEPITINGANYNAFKADLKYDGKTVILRLEPSHQ